MAKEPHTLSGARVLRSIVDTETGNEPILNMRAERGGMRTIRVSAAMAFAALILLAAGVAGAQETDDVYAGGSVSPTTVTVPATDPPSTAATPTSQPIDTQGSLPLTGGDIAGIVAIGLGALAVGGSLIALQRRRSTQSPGA